MLQWEMSEVRVVRQLRLTVNHAEVILSRSPEQVTGAYMVTRYALSCQLAELHRAWISRIGEMQVVR
jgi:hypothetical protein